MLRQSNSSVEHAFQVALDIEEYLTYPIARKIRSQAPWKQHLINLLNCTQKKKKKIGSQPWEAVFKKFVEANYGDKVSLSQMFKQSNGSKPSFIGLLSSF